MGPIEILLEVSQKLYGHVKSGLPKEKREAYITRLNELLDQRQSIMEQLPETYSEKDKKIGSAIVQINQSIEPILTEQLHEIKNDIIVMKQKKSKSVQYANPYASYNPDGMFLDQRK
ncbi:hypothetical protein WD019_13595 [Fictibacillus sp. Mic-4]|uniref:hypothetical protein n=1 Tax=Fictibacillus sp. Mic-4 TaxID=3132826 RepID=UPI003CF48737